MVLTREEFTQLAMLHAPAVPAPRDFPVQGRLVETKDRSGQRIAWSEDATVLEREIAWRKAYAQALARATFE